MAAFPTKSATYILPQHSPDETIELTISEKFTSTYRPPIPAPPSGPLNAKGLKERVSYGCMIGCNRNISPRFEAFVQGHADKCAALVRGKFRSQVEKDILKANIIREENMLRSRYNEVHGPNGLCGKICLGVTTMREIRL